MGSEIWLILRRADIVCVEYWLNEAREVLSWDGFYFTTEYTAPRLRRELRGIVTCGLCREVHLARISRAYMAPSACL